MPDRSPADTERTSGGGGRTASQSEVDTLNARAETLRSGVAAMGLGGGSAMKAMQQELNAVEADLAARYGPPFDGDLSATPAFTPSLGAMDGFLPGLSGVMPFAATGASSDPIHVGGTSSSVYIHEETDQDGNSSIVVSNHNGTEIGNYAPGSTIDIEAGAGAAQIDVADGTDVSLNVEASDENNFLDIDGGTSDVDVAGNEYSNIIFVSTEGAVTVDGGRGNDRIEVTEADEVEIRSSGGSNGITVDDARIVDIQATGTGSNEISVSDVAGRVDVETGNGDQVVDIAGAGNVDVMTGDGNDQISATGIRGRATVDSGNATDYIETRRSGMLWWKTTETENIEGSDSVIIEADRDVDVTTGDGWDSIEATSTGGNVTIASQSGRDDILASADGTAKVESGDQNDTVDVTNATLAEVDGGAHNDTITITNATNATVHGRAGNDVIDTYGAGQATVYGEGGNDYIRTGNGVDIIHGGAGDDNIYGGAGDDEIYGQGGRDYVDGGRG